MGRALAFVCAVVGISAGSLHGRRSLTGSQFDEEGSVQRPPPTEKDIDALVLETLNKSHTPSVSIAITRNGTLVWSKAYGSAYLEPPVVKARTNTLYWLASITKTATALVVAQLEERGLLDLDRDVNDYLPFGVRNPHFPDVRITPRLLATHTSSIQDGDIWEDLLSYAGGDPVVQLKDALPAYFTPGGQYNERMNFHKYRPGAAYDYSNIAVSLLGYLCEVVAGQPYVTLATELVLHPLGMHRSFWYYTDAARMGIELRPEVAMPYAWKKFHKRSGPGMLVPKGFYGYPDIPAGMLRTSAPQLSQVASLLSCRGTLAGRRILKPETVDAMLSNQTSAAILDDAQGLIFYSPTTGTAATRGQPLWGHNGGDVGASTDMFFTRDGGVGLVVLTNSEAFGKRTAIADGMAHLEQRLFEFAWTLPEPSEPCAGSSGLDDLQV